MLIVLAGATGRTGRRLIPLLTAAGHATRALTRSDGPVPGAEAHRLDLATASADELDRAVDGADAVIWLAGPGGGSVESAERLDNVACCALIDACVRQDVRRFVLVTSKGTAAPERAPDFLRPYLEIKAKAEAHLAGSGLTWSVLRPGGLTDDEPTGGVVLGDGLGRGRVTRADVAAVVAELVGRHDQSGRASEVLGGELDPAAAFDAITPAVNIVDFLFDLRRLGRVHLAVFGGSTGEAMAEAKVHFTDWQVSAGYVNYFEGPELHFSRRTRWRLEFGEGPGRHSGKDEYWVMVRNERGEGVFRFGLLRPEGSADHDPELIAAYRVFRDHYTGKQKAVA
ncbi:SDR family oxidoreductase [Streptomyces sp. NPDC058953]|uniref:SDR family oxidoreductase n=1 Tax=unclassified Streptomyces TaxID=2593676 RepID=UPI00369FE26A